MRKTLLRFAVRLFATVAPGAAARWFERRLTTPIVAPQLAVPAPSATGAIRHVPFGAGRLVVTTWGSGKTVLLLHGWGGASRSLWAFVNPLVARGFRVAAFDFPAHGSSPDRQTSMPECAEAIRAVVDAIGPVEAVVAHSFGASAAALSARKGARFGRWVLLAPPRSIRDLSRHAALDVGLPEAVFDRVELEFSAHRGLDWRTLDTDRLVREIGEPLLVIHDASDQTTPLAEGRAVADAAPHGRLVTTKGLGHRGLLRDDGVVQQAVEFVAGG